MAESGSSQNRGWIGWIQIGGIVAVVLIALAITVALSGGGEAGPAQREPDTRVPVDLTVPVQSSHQIRIEATGTVEAKAFVTLTPQVGGQVVEVSEAVRAGGRFEAGEVLFSIDQRDYQVAVQRADAAVADARSALAQIEAEAAIAREEWSTTFPGRQITPLAAREPQLEAARSRLMSSRADLRQARINLDRTTLSFPFEGRITESRIERGQVVAAGQSYGQVYSIGELELVVPVPPEDAARLEGAQGRPVSIVFEGGQTMNGRVLREGARLDPRSRLIALYVTPEDAAALRPGLFADVTIEGPEIERTYAVPEAALAGLNSVHVVRDGRIEQVDVDVVDRVEGRVHLAPFDHGQGVIVTPLPEGAAGREANVLDSGADPQSP